MALIQHVIASMRRNCLTVMKGPIRLATQRGVPCIPMPIGRSFPRFCVIVA